MEHGLTITLFQGAWILSRCTLACHFTRLQCWRVSYSLVLGFLSQLGALFTFNPNPDGEYQILHLDEKQSNKQLQGATSILVRAGISFVSTEQACANAEEEIPTFDFDGVQAAALAEWNELLGRIQVEPTGVDNDTVSLFYSSLYRIHVVPADCRFVPHLCCELIENCRSGRYGREPPMEFY